MDPARVAVRVAGDPERAALQSNDSRASAAIGRAARLELVFARRGHRTIISHAYAEPPFRIGRMLSIDDAAYVIIVCCGPGVFGGDTLEQSVRVERGARAVLTSQSALQVHPAFRPSCLPASCRQDYLIDDDAELHCHWDPVIPFADSALEQGFNLAMSEGGCLYWSDALMSGRASRGEAWRFHELAHTLRLRVAGRLQYLERYHVAPRDRDVARRWMAGDAHYCSTTLVRHPRVTADEVESLHRSLDGRDRVSVAADCVEQDLMVVRTMGTGGAPFAAARAAIRAHVLRTIFHRPDLAGRK